MSTSHPIDARPRGLPSEEEIRSLPTTPLRVMVSACLGGRPCTFDATSCGDHQVINELMALPNFHSVLFCPEEYAFGCPRELCNIVAGDGFAVLDGQARVETHDGQDWSEGMIRAADRMLEVAREERIDLAILLDISAACGTTTIYDGHRDNKNYRKGPGVCAARLMEAGIGVMSQRDFGSLEILRNHLDPTHRVDESAYDHHRSSWYIEYFELVDITHPLGYPTIDD